MENAPTKYGLLSPYKQLFFLIGIVLGTSEPRHPKQLTPLLWRRICSLLKEIFDQYGLVYFPDSDDPDAQTEHWFNVRRVAMPAFLHYFNTGGKLASVEQLRHRIRGLLILFDASLASNSQISASIALEITDWISQTLQSNLDELQDALRGIEASRRDFFKRMDEEHWSEERSQQEFRLIATGSPVLKAHDLISRLYQISFDEILQQFGREDTFAYWRRFTSHRGSPSSFKYLTDPNPAELAPLILIDEQNAICPVANSLYTAILDRITALLMDGAERESFLRRRDRFLELQTEDVLVRFFGPETKTYSSLFETADLRYEHDHIIVWHRNLFIVEDKATPPDEPFRDPDRAFVRLKRAFKSDKGIQKAFDQANRLRQRILAEQAISLFDEEGKVALSLSIENLENIYCVCVTADDFGPLAAHLSLLLDKEPEDPYPWAVNIFDLETFFDGLSHRGLGPSELCSYLDARLGLYDRVFTTDELEVAGIFLRDKTLDMLTDSPGNLLVLGPDTSKVFDDIYIEKHGGPKVDFSKQEELVTHDVRAMIEEVARAPKPVTTRLQHPDGRKVGRNEPCPCGSGTKYKKCCWDR